MNDKRDGLYGKGVTDGVYMEESLRERRWNGGTGWNKKRYCD